MTSNAKILVRAGIVLAVSLASNAIAGIPEDQAEIESLKRQLHEQFKLLAEQRQQLQTELNKLENHRKSLEETQRRLDGMVAQWGATEEPRPRKATPFETSAATGRGTDTTRVDTSLDVANVFYQPTILTPKGGFVFEPSLQYAYSSSTRANVVGYTVLDAVLIGLIDVRNVNHSSWIGSIGGRYGLTNRLELEAKIPFMYRKDDTLTRPINLTTASQDKLFTADGTGLGDIEIAARYQLNFPKGDDPFYIAGLRLKTKTGKGPFDVPYSTRTGIRGSFATELPTGSGSYSLQPSISAVLPADPAVFFGGINYIWNIKSDVSKSIVTGMNDNKTPDNPNDDTPITEFIGDVDPGDSVGINFGMGIALNERSSFSLGYEHQWIGKTTSDNMADPTVTSVQLASLLAGYSYRLSDRTSINLSFAAGLTSDTPDTTVTLRVPIRY